MSTAALVTAFKARIPDARLKQITNPKNKAASVTSETQLTNAATDTVALFVTHAGIELDTSDDVHVMVGVRVMEALLLAYASSTAGQAAKLWKSATELLEKMALSRGGRDAILMTSNSQVTTTRDREKRPWFDPRHFDGFRADVPTGGEGHSSDGRNLD